MYKEDISYKLGYWYLFINKDYDGKRIKNRYVIWEILIFEYVIWLGFIDFVKFIDLGYLFKDVKYNERDGYGRVIFRWFSGEKSKWFEVEDDLLKYNFFFF